MDLKEERIRSIAHMYYSNPKVQEAIVRFAKDREVVPRYFENFGKRPDVIQYISDVYNAVKNGATSFHASEELWNDPLAIDSGIHNQDLNNLRKSWDLLIDVDSPFLDYSKIATKLLIEVLEQHGVRNYGVKFSGSKGFHIIISGMAFPKEYNGFLTKDMFPDWPRAICEYLMYYLRDDYNKAITHLGIDFAAIERRTNLTKEQLEETRCEQCGKPMRRGSIAVFLCPVCSMRIERKNVKVTKRRLKCLNVDCAGVLEVVGTRGYYFCEHCESDAVSSEKTSEINAAKIASLDLVLVAPRHLFRMPYSLNEKTALASVVLSKKVIDSFHPKDADPLKVTVKEFLPPNADGEAQRLLRAALEWKKEQTDFHDKFIAGKYEENSFEKIDLKNINERMFPPAIKKLLQGLKDGRKRGLFVLLAFLRSLNFSPEYINEKTREWNKKNDPPLKEGYIRSQIEWHLRQQRKILPPNYSNDAFYRDLGILESKPKAKNPIVEVARKVRKENKG